MQEALEVASRSRTTVCIAHRLSTIKNADNIIVMSRGEIIEQGTHNDLYALDGMYRGLVDAQRISAQSTKDSGEITPESEAEEEEEDVIRRMTSNPAADNLVRRTTTGQSAQTTQTVDIRQNQFGVVEKKKYSLGYLLKKVSLVGWIG